MVQAICQAWNQSHVNAYGRSGPLHQDIAATLNEYTREGNNWRIDAHILDVFYPYNTSTHSLAHDTTVGDRRRKQKKFLPMSPEPKIYAMLMYVTEGIGVHTFEDRKRETFLKRGWRRL